MASTRNKNTQGDFKQEQIALSRIADYNDYNKSSFYGVPENIYFAGNGLGNMKTAANLLSNNSCDIESQLLGIGSTNLVNPLPTVIPDIKYYQSANICDRLTPVAYMDVRPEPNQRPMWLN